MRDTSEYLRGLFGETDQVRPPLTDEMVQAAEAAIGYRLPSSYLAVLRIRNGGYLTRSRFPTTLCPRYAKNHISFHEIMGIGEDHGIDAKLGSRYRIAEWDSPDVGIVIETEGHTAFMLDYSECGREGEPRVIRVDVETGDGGPNVVVLAPTFRDFVSQLREPTIEDE